MGLEGARAIVEAGGSQHKEDGRMEGGRGGKEGGGKGKARDTFLTSSYLSLCNPTLVQSRLLMQKPTESRLV